MKCFNVIKIYLILALLLPLYANATPVKSPVCGIGMKCVSQETTCPIKKAAKKKPALYKAPKQTVIPEVEEKPCVNEIYFYYIEEPYVPYNHVDRHPIDNAIRPQTDSVFYGWGSNVIGGWSGNNFPSPYVIVFNEKCVECCKPDEVELVATPVPNSAYLLMSGCLLFLRRRM